MPRIFFCLLFFCLATPMWSQPPTQEELEQRKAKIQQEILEKQEQLNLMKTKEKSVVGQLLIQKEKIGLKEKLIRTTEKQTKLLSNDIYVNQLKINQLNRDLEQLRKDYAEMILKSYKSRSEQSRAMFLLSSQNFLQAYKRAQYMKQYASYRKMQGEEIKGKTKQLEDYNVKIGVQKLEKEKLIAENEKEKQELVKEKQEQEKIANQIKKEKGKITAEIKKKQAETKKIDAQIKKMIRDAIIAANKKTAAANVKANPKITDAEKKAIESSTNIVLTPEGKLVSNNFKANKGRLPWPVEKGVISLGYGNQPHPVFKTIEVHNSGIEISTESGASARAVFSGEVVQIQQVTPLKKAVLVRHGDFFTLYQNLSSVNVQPGDKVSAKEVLGKIRTDADGRTVLKFVISQNSTYFNPTTWLSSR
ncbi:peptidoglycan DD-metalloendopeptidase family protein [Flavobacterium sp. J49]|uniref:murein hydrolase activator EnvC family protein n=1 Tax=Flavobacterium sp. J49 TaxID=2718534 RepID=UPI001593D06E|nr:peptidoglycan DD-metalloendopeptidase family protein [Flavobacterium sp. J49]MBF6641507.1 peptidoglycan DD-metalloendopeptidase family protein [Flavobacterium sp. J49]NIC02754.1 peptidoglycan DD-metalloendopeptidase family protein [Flavobacterium sp. J49]